MQNGLLDHLDEIEFFAAIDELSDNMEEGLKKTLDHWLELGYIDKQGYEKILEEWSDNFIECFNCLG